MPAIRAADPNVITLEAAAKLYGVSEDTARRMARAGDFPGLITTTRRSGAKRRWMVSVPRFNQEIHGTTLVPSAEAS